MQITIDIDAKTLNAWQAGARRNRLSLSKWLKKNVPTDLETELKEEWPENYFSLFGVLEDDDIQEPAEIPFSEDTIRESL